RAFTGPWASTRAASSPIARTVPVTSITCPTFPSCSSCAWARAARRMGSSKAGDGCSSSRNGAAMRRASSSAAFSWRHSAQPEKRLLQEGPAPGARSRALWVDLATGHGVDHRVLAVGPFRVEAVRAPETIPPRLVDAEIARDCVQPGLEARAPFPGRRALDDSQEGLLRQILGPLAVAQHTQEER